MDSNNNKNIRKVEEPESYLTDMKELPPAREQEFSVNKNKVEESVAKKTTEIPMNKEKKFKLPKKEKSENSFYTKKDVILGIVNLVTVAILIFLLTKLPIKSKEFQMEKALEILNAENPEAVFGDIEPHKEKADQLSKLFLDESGIVNFVGEVEKLKGEGSAIQKVTFTSQKPVKDKTGFTGIPVIIEMKGNWQEIAGSMEKIQSLPFLFRPVNIEALPVKDEPGITELGYGAILYVNEKEVTGN